MGALRIYHRDPEVKHLKRMYVTKCAIQFFGKSLPVSKMLDRIDDMGAPDTGNVPVEFTNMVCDALQTSFTTFFNSNKFTEICHR